MRAVDGGSLTRAVAQPVAISAARMSQGIRTGMPRAYVQVSC
jgi:hypothetical protein